MVQVGVPKIEDSKWVEKEYRELEKKADVNVDFILVQLCKRVELTNEGRMEEVPD